VTDPGTGSNAQPGEVLVIGLGNDLRGDDGAGRAVVEELTRAAAPGVRAIWSHQLVPELVEQLAVARLVVFVDADPGARAAADVDADPGAAPVATDDAAGASLVGAPAGAVVRRISPGPPAAAGHHADPAALLGLAALAGYPVPQAYLVGVPAHELGLGTTLTPTARAGVDAAVRTILALAGAAGR